MLGSLWELRKWAHRICFLYLHHYLKNCNKSDELLVGTYNKSETITHVADL